MRKINELIDQIYYVNLDVRTDRQFFMERRFANFDINSNRITAINGKVLDSFLAKFFERNSDKFFISSLRINGFSAATFSHWMAVQDALEHGYETILIFEDDAILHKDFEVYIDKIFTEIETKKIDWDLIFLGHYTRTLNNFTGQEIFNLQNIKLKENEDELIYEVEGLNTRPWCSHAMLYSNQNGLFNDIISAYSNHIPDVVDTYHLDAVTTKNNKKYFIIYPQIAIQTFSKCAIANGENMNDFSSSYDSWSFTPQGNIDALVALNQYYIDIEKDFLI